MKTSDPGLSRIISWSTPDIFAKDKTAVIPRAKPIGVPNKSRPKKTRLINNSMDKNPD
jgi:hypothetical protein